MLNNCKVCDRWTEQEICDVCIAGGEQYQGWRKRLKDVCDQHWVLGNVSFFPGEYALQLYTEGETPERALDIAKEAFDRFIASEQDEMARDERQWKQFDAGMDVTIDCV